MLNTNQLPKNSGSRHYSFNITPNGLEVMFCYDVKTYIPAVKYLFKVNNKDTKMFMVIILVFSLLTLRRYLLFEINLLINSLVYSLNG